MNAKIINAFGRKEGDPLPGATEAQEQVKPCDRTVKTIEAYLKLAKDGDLRGVALASTSNGYPVFSVIGSDTADAREMAALNIAIDEMKNVVLHTVFGGADVEDLEDGE
jgi:hypothetical protein